MPKREKRYSAPALEKGLEIIELLARTPDGLGLTDISEHLGRTKTELFRMLCVLHDAGYLDYSDSDHIYKAITSINCRSNCSESRTVSRRCTI